MTPVFSKKELVEIILTFYCSGLEGCSIEEANRNPVIKRFWDLGYADVKENEIDIDINDNGKSYMKPIIEEIISEIANYTFENSGKYTKEEIGQWYGNKINYSNSTDIIMLVEYAFDHATKFGFGFRPSKQTVSCYKKKEK